MTVVSVSSPSILYTDLYNWVMPDFHMPPPTTMVTNAIRDAVIELCEKTLMWRQELQQILVLGPVSTTTSAASASGATTLTLADTTKFVDGVTLTVVLSDGTKWRGHQSGAPAGSVITLDGALNLDVLSGAAVTLLTYLYSITLPSGSMMAKGISAWINDAPIDPISQDDLDNEFNNTSFGWVGTNWRTDVNLPTRFYFPDDNTVGLLLAPNTNGNMRILAALKPTRASTSFPQWIYEREVETIAHGAKWRILRTPKKPYTDLQLAAYHREEFYGGLATARVRVARAATRGPLRSHTVYGLR